MLLQHSNLRCPSTLPPLAPQSCSRGSLHNSSAPVASADPLLLSHSCLQGMHACKSHVRYRLTAVLTCSRSIGPAAAPCWKIAPTPLVSILVKPHTVCTPSVSIVC